ncbi:uncharacterized protein LOC122498184 [Leptopilina heterotoma]|uniref:uncharacterized protein LOC122498184 n=1 Tax=Leptopilina heterotoma TaxID=63436 RepID=UPI001CA8E8BE|nr:uncharacterized protein LOC122498184 [Leptopilina heterotoma]
MNSTIITQHLLSNQFLPVCQYITIFGIIFYKNGLITLKKKSETIPVLNTFFEYLNESENESETKLQFLQNVLNQSGGHYGNREYQPLDMKYVKETYHHIINTALFSPYGNIDGYLTNIFKGIQNKSDTALKKAVLQHLLQNYTNEDYCSSQRKGTKLTLLASTTIFKDFIWPLLKEKHSLLTRSYNKHRISKRGLTNNNSLEVSEESNDLSESNMEFFSELGEEFYYEGLEAIQLFQQKGLSFFRNDMFVLESLRISVNFISMKQISETDNNNTLDLWFSHIIDRPSFVDYLKNIKEDFYFNDITLLTDIHPGPIHPKKPSRISLKTEVRYHMKFYSRYGLVDLVQFHHSFKNQYIVFPEVEFLVVDTRYHNGKDILILHLEEKLMPKEEWLNIRNKEYALSSVPQSFQRKRLESIKNSAFDIALKTPLHRLHDTEEILKQYILRIDQKENLVPTYDMLADDIYSSITIPETYDVWKIKRNIYIDDVLYKENLRHLDLVSGVEKINQIYDGAYREDEVLNVWYNYKKLFIINNMRFEDYFAIYSQFSASFKTIKYREVRVLAALYRLAIMQCDERWIENPITLYFAENIPIENFREMVDKTRGEIINSSSINFGFFTEEAALKDCLTTTSSERLVLYQMELKSQAGIAGVSRIFRNADFSCFVTKAMKLKKDIMRKTTIAGRDVYTLILKDAETPKENVMVTLIQLLSNILSEDILFYVD